MSLSVVYTWKYESIVLCWADGLRIIARLFVGLHQHYGQHMCACVCTCVLCADNKTVLAARNVCTGGARGRVRVVQVSKQIACVHIICVMVTGGRRVNPFALCAEATQSIIEYFPKSHTSLYPHFVFCFRCVGRMPYYAHRFSVKLCNFTTAGTFRYN